MGNYKYYIEISEKDDVGYIFQSVWFHTEKDALDWFDKFVYINSEYDAWLMYSEWDEEADDYIDIQTLRKL